MTGRRCSGFAALAAFLSVATACNNAPPIASDTPARMPSPARTSAEPARHVFVIVLENHAYSQIVGSSSAPYLNSLAERYGLATNDHGVSHPSLPNYLALIGGSTFGITDDCTDCFVDGNNLGAQLIAKGVSWKGYMEGMPSVCYEGGTYGRYAKRHNPFVYFRNIASSPAACGAHVVPLTAFSRDTARGALPSFSFITPDVCHDMHDCGIGAGDSWLRSFVPQILASSAYRSGGILVITFDEDYGSSGNHIATIVISSRIRAGARSSRLLSHYSLLRAIEDTYGLARLGHAAEPTTASLFATFGA